MFADNVAGLVVPIPKLPVKYEFPVPEALITPPTLTTPVFGFNARFTPPGVYI